MHTEDEVHRTVTSGQESTAQNTACLKYMFMFSKIVGETQLSTEKCGCAKARGHEVGIGYTCVATEKSPLP